MSLSAKIAEQLYQAFETLGAPVELLSIIGSYGDTLNDDEVLTLLTEWNKSGKVIVNQIADRTPKVH